MAIIRKDCTPRAVLFQLDRMPVAPPKGERYRPKGQWISSREKLRERNPLDGWTQFRPEGTFLQGLAYHKGVGRNAAEDVCFDW